MYVVTHARIIYNSAYLYVLPYAPFTDRRLFSVHNYHMHMAMYTYLKVVFVLVSRGQTKFTMNFRKGALSLIATMKAIMPLRET